MSLTKIEQETIILFNEGEADAEVYTHNVKLKNKLTRIAKKHPDLYRLKAKNAHGGVTYIFPKKLLTVIFREPVSQENKELYREHCKQVQPRKYRRDTP